MQIYEADQHPMALADVTCPTIVRSPVIQLTKHLGELVCNQPRIPVGVPSAWRDNYTAMATAFRRCGTVSIPEGDEGHWVSNAPIPSHWICDYKMTVRGHLKKHSFAALIHFGPGHVTEDHIEESAAATYGCLIEGQKEWEFRQSNRATMKCIQYQGDTVYIPPGFIHWVKTTSNGAIIIGETEVTEASVLAFAKNATKLVHGLGGFKHNPEPEARHLCDVNNIPISGRLEERRGTWYAGAATQALLAHAAAQVGGTERRDKLGKKRRRRVFSSRHGRKHRKRQSTRTAE